MNRRTLASILLGAGALQGSCAQEPWRLATGFRSDLFHTRNLDTLVQDVDRATAGKLRIELHADNVVAPLADIAQAVETGELHAGETIMSSLIPQMPIAGADSVPFIVHTYEDARRLWRHQRPSIEHALAARGLHALFAVPWPPQCLFSSRPLSHITDLRGLRMRTYNPTTRRIAELVGATAVDVPEAGVADAVTGKLIDVMITSAVTGAQNRVWHGMKYFYEINAWFPKNIVFVNATVFDALDRPRRDALVAASREAETRGWAASAMAAAEATQDLRQHGMAIERPSPEVLMEIKILGERFSREWVRHAGSEANTVLNAYFAHS
jgi:TRAP-type transport system periplasmic protein